MRCECGEKLTKGTEKRRIVVGEQTFVATIPVQVCAQCKETLVEGRVLEALDRSIASHLAQHGPATAETFRFIRKAVGLPAKELAVILGTSPETISRWENGRHELDVWAWTTLAAIVAESIEGRTDTLARLRALHGAKLRKTVPIIVDVA